MKQLEDTVASAEVKNCRTVTSLFNSFESDKEVKEINKKYLELQKDYLNLKNKGTETLCVKLLLGKTYP